MTKYKIPSGKIISIICLIVVASFLNHIYHIWSLPIKNQVTVNQLNGGGAEFIALHSTNSFLTNIQTLNWPIFLFFILLIIAFEIKKVVKMVQENREEESQKGDTA